MWHLPKKKKRKAIGHLEAALKVYSDLQEMIGGRKPQDISLEELRRIRDYALEGSHIIRAGLYFLNDLDYPKPPYHFYQGDLMTLGHVGGLQDVAEVYMHFLSLHLYFESFGTFEKGKAKAEETYLSLLEYFGEDVPQCLTDSYKYYQEELAANQRPTFGSTYPEDDKLNPVYAAGEELIKLCEEHALGERGRGPVRLFSNIIDFNYHLYCHDYILSLIEYNRNIDSAYVQMAKKLKLEEINVLELVEEVLRERPYFSHHKVNLVKDYNIKPDTIIRYSRDCLKWMLMRLLSNAEWFTQPVDNPTLWVLLEQSGGEVRITVKDNGVGPEKADEVIRMKDGQPVPRGKGKKTSFAFRFLKRITGIFQSLARKGELTEATIRIPTVSASG